MSRKLFLEPYRIVTAGDMSANITSAESTVNQIDNVGIQLDFTGTPTGTFTVEAQRHPSADWVAIDFGSTISASGAAGNHRISISSKENKVRVKYTRSSGTGTLNAYIVGG